MGQHAARRRVERRREHGKAGSIDVTIGTIDARAAPGTLFCDALHIAPETVGESSEDHRGADRKEGRSDRGESILLVLMRVIEFGGVSNGREKVEFADVYIQPDLLRFKRNDFHAAAEIVEVGYGATRQSLADWLATSKFRYGTRRPDLFPG